MRRYAERELAAGGRLSPITRHMLGLYAGEPGAREYRRALSEGARQAGALPDLLRPGHAKPDLGKVASGLKTLAYNRTQAHG